MQYESDAKSFFSYLSKFSSCLSPVFLFWVTMYNNLLLLT